MEKFGKLLTETIRNEESAKRDGRESKNGKGDKKEKADPSDPQKYIKFIINEEPGYVPPKDEKQTTMSSMKRSKSQLDPFEANKQRKPNMNEDRESSHKETFNLEKTNSMNEPPMTFKLPEGTMRIKENVEGFISLIKKFSFKIKSFSEYILSLQTTSNKEIVEEVRETFRIYHSLLENPNLASNLIENKPYYPLKETSYINQFSLTNMFTNLERVIDELHSKNEQLDLEKNALQKQAVIKKEYDELKNVHDKYKNDFTRVLQYNKDLESKLSILEEENSNLRKTIAYEKDKFDDLLRQKLCTLNKEIRYKDSKIQYYENIVQSMKGK
jgi:hypothetical protein